ncbi:thiazole synthase [Mycobacterium sp. NPDC051804]|uniref:thiazole synthase n=1 Tax=Mycobacterium sp. NPDC051804 TaxID=3364295 RepID=UPI0037B3B21D
MLIRRPSAWILGSAMAAAIAHSMYAEQIAQAFADAFEPDLEAWEHIPVGYATAQLAG